MQDSDHSPNSESSNGGGQVSFVVEQNHEVIVRSKGHYNPNSTKSNDLAESLFNQSPYFEKLFNSIDPS